MSRDSFIREVLPYAKQASADTDVPVSVVLAHWGHETAWGTSRAWTVDHNPAGLMSGGRPIHFADLTAGVAGYIRTLLNPRYAAVRAAKTPEDTIVALGRSDYDQDHYGGDGRLVLNTWKSAKVAKYDTASPSLLNRAKGAIGAMPLPGAPAWSIDKAGATADDAKKAVTTTADLIDFITGQGLRRVAIGGVLIAGGVGLVVAGAWRGFMPEEIRAAAKTATKTAALA